MERAKDWSDYHFNKIRAVTNIDPCEDCGKGRCVVELENGAKITTHDDGSFWEWTGGQE